MTNPPILALDFPSSEAVNRLLEHFNGKKLYVKVGMQLFYQQGPAIIELLKRDGHRIFLDLKLHDIPNTVMQAMKGLATLGVDMVNVHAAGGKQMMEAAVEGLEAGKPAGAERPICIAVTQLTSTSEKVMHDELLVNGSMKEVVTHYAKLARVAGLDGVVSSAWEVPKIKEVIPGFITVTPGIRMQGDEQNDQSRIVTPREAKRFGSDFIVIGRTVTQSADPLQAYERVLQEWTSN